MSAKNKPIKSPGLALQALESRCWLELYSTLWSYPFLRRAPRGDGHPVLVLPGFLASGTSTFILRWFLKGLGYRGHRWKLGHNLGPIGEVEHDIIVRLHELRRRYGRKVSLIGWSLGGVYAREIARAAPDDVRLVITLGSPVREHESSTVSWLYRAITGQTTDTMGAELVAQASRPPPVPTTCVYSRTDGVVPWQSSLEDKTRHTENIRVESSHLGLGMHPAVLWLIADRLAQPEGAWQPFESSGLQCMLYPRADQRESARQSRASAQRATDRAASAES